MNQLTNQAPGPLRAGELGCDTAGLGEQQVERPGL
jgi:hypothetical protein